MIVKNEAFPISECNTVLDRLLKKDTFIEGESLWDFLIL